MTESLIIGIIRSPHGLTGRLKVESTSGEYAHFAALQEVTIRFKDGVEKRCVVEAVSGGEAGFYMKFAGIDTPEDARRFNGATILAPREQAAPLKDGEYYVEDLTGCQLVCEDVVVGTVLGMIEGAGQLLEVAPAPDADGGVKSVYVPFRNEFVGQVDIAQRRIELLHRWILE